MSIGWDKLPWALVAALVVAGGGVQVTDWLSPPDLRECEAELAVAVSAAQRCAENRTCCWSKYEAAVSGGDPAAVACP